MKTPHYHHPVNQHPSQHPSQHQVDPRQTENLALTSWVWLRPLESSANRLPPTAPSRPDRKPTCKKLDPFYPVRQWLNSIEVNNPQLAHALCKNIPSQCPFERDIKLFDRTLFHIPPLCKLNPVYDEVVALRFRALCYLADICGEDIAPYC